MLTDYEHDSEEIFVHRDEAIRRYKDAIERILSNDDSSDDED